MIINNTPYRLSDKQKELCRRLDEFYKIALNNEGITFSNIFRGALYTMDPIRRNQNPDWMAQSAHSYRDILYPFYRNGADLKREKAFVKYGSSGKLGQLSADIGHYYGFFSDVAHHNLKGAATNPIANGSKKDPVPITEAIFTKVAEGFEGILFESLRRQMDAHKEIDGLIGRAAKDIETTRELIDFNNDARRYFYSKAGEDWLDWLWENGFFSALMEAPEDSVGYFYPELDYLDRVAAHAPSRVVDIMLSIPIGPDRFDPEIVDRFARISQSLPAHELARIVPKIRNEKWICLMGVLNRWGFAYERMLKILADASDYSSLLTLAEPLLEVRPNESQIKSVRKSMPDNPFCFNEIADTKVFEKLASVDEGHVESALGLVVNTLAAIVRLGNTTDHEVFEYNDEFLLIDIDFFTVEFGEDKTSYRKNLHELAAAVKKLIQRSIGSGCDDTDAAKRIYDTCLRSLPNSQSTWRLKLFATSLCPILFRDDLQAAFFKIFEYKEPWPLIRGAEYEWAIKKGFSALSDEDQRIYISSVISHFGDKGREDWQKNVGWRLLSSAYPALNKKEIEQAQEVFGRALNPDYHPQASIGGMQCGFVTPKAPIRIEELSLMPVSHIVTKLKGEWAPEQLRDQDNAQDFLKPLNAEGMGNALRLDIVRRPGNYLADARLFFDRDYLDPHYTFAFLSGIKDVLHDKKCPPGVDISNLVTLFHEIVGSADICDFPHGLREGERGDTWLVGWDGVYSMMADVLQELFKESGIEHGIDLSVFRISLLNILSHLLSHPDPEPETGLTRIETIERDPPQTGAEVHAGGDPLAVAINSVRGGAFEAFVFFVQRDIQSFPKDSLSRLSTDVKELFQKCLDAEKTLAIRFLFGHFLTFFYYQDRAWIHDIIPKIFPDNPGENDLYLAAWEGYLSRDDLYQELFEELSAYYQRAILLNPGQYTLRTYNTDLDEGLAKHVALAFIHYPAFNFYSDLFTLFWKANNNKRKREFISFIGRLCFSRDDAAMFIKHGSIDIEKLKAFWDWALEHCTDPETLTGFSFWVVPERDVFHPEWLAGRLRQTLERTEGNTESNREILRSLPFLAENAPLDTLKILKIYLLGAKGLISRQPWHFLDDEMLGVFRTLYSNPLSKDDTYRLIDELLPVGNGQFWRLKEIISSK